MNGWRRSKTMTRACSVLLLCCVLFACSTTERYPDTKSTAVVTIKGLLPAAKTVVDESSVLRAEIDYVIADFDPAAEYYLAPLFDSTKGAGHTFNEYQRLTDGYRLNTPSGTVQVEYPIRREWRNPQLARPVRVSFYVMQRIGAHQTRVIGRTEPVQFGPPSRTKRE
ncbi:MAG: hypothetical protein ACXW4P_16820 [Thermoanaerobaculia bacterium]